MSRVTTTLVILLLIANGIAGVMSASGLSEDIGIEIDPGIANEMDKITAEMKQGFQPGTGIVESLLSTLIAGGRVFLLVMRSMTAAPAMMINLGFPNYLVVALFSPVYLIGTMELLSLLMGRRLT